MNIPELLDEQDQALLKKFRDLPKEEKNEIIVKAEKIIKDIIVTVPKAIVGQEGFTDKEKQGAIEFLFGRLGQTEDEAMQEDSQFSRFFNSALVFSVLEVMREQNNT